MAKKCSRRLSGLLLERSSVLFVYGSDEIQFTPRVKEIVDLLRSQIPDIILFDISRDRSVRNAVKELSGWDFFPQLFVHKEFIGGSLVIEEFLLSGEYGRVLKELGSNSDWLDSNGTELPRTAKNGKIWRLTHDVDSGAIAGASSDGNVHLWDSSKRNQITSLKLSNGWVNAVAISSGDNRLFAGLSDGTLRMVDLASLDQIVNVQAHSRWVNDLVISDNGEVLWSVSADRHLTAWHAQTLDRQQSVEAHETCVWCVCLSVSETIIATGSSDGIVKFWRAIDLTLVGEVQAHTGCVTSLSIVNGKFASCSFDGTIAIFNSQLEIESRCVGHSERIWTISGIGASPLCLSASGDGSVRLWDTNASFELGSLIFSSMPIAVAHDPSNDTVFISHDDGKVTTYPLSKLQYKIESLHC